MSSNKPGPTILLSGGLHGDEYNGIEIVKGILRRGFKLNKGNLIMIPILNKYGYKKGLRYDDSNLDINRCFTRNSDNRVCRFLMDEIIPHIDYGIDFHTGGAKRTNYPQIRCSVGDTFQLDIAKTFLENSDKYLSEVLKDAPEKGSEPIIQLNFEYLHLQLIQMLNVNLSGYFHLD